MQNFLKFHKKRKLAEKSCYIFKSQYIGSKKGNIKYLKINGLQDKTVTCKIEFIKYILLGRYTSCVETNKQ